MTPLRLSSRQQTLHFSEVSCTPSAIELRSSAGDSVRIAVDSGPKQAFVISRIGGAPEHLAKSPLIPAGEDYIWEPTLPGSYIVRSAIYSHLNATVAVLPSSSRSPSTSSAVDDVISLPLRSNTRPGLLSVSSRVSPSPSPSSALSNGGATFSPSGAAFSARSAHHGDVEEVEEEEEDEYTKHPSLGGLRQRRKSNASSAEDSHKQARVLAALKNRSCSTPDVEEEFASPPSPPPFPRRPQYQPRFVGGTNGNFRTSDLDPASDQMLKLVDVSRTSGLDAATVSAQRQQQQQKAAATAVTHACRRCSKEFLAQCTARRCEASHPKQNGKKQVPALASPDDVREFWDRLAAVKRREVFDVSGAPDAVHAVHLLAASKVKSSDAASSIRVHLGGVGLANSVLKPESLAALTGKNAVNYLDATTESTLLFGGMPLEDPISKPSDVPSVCEAAAVLGFTVARRLLTLLQADAVRRADEAAAALEAMEEAAKPAYAVAGAKKKSKKKKAKQQQQQAVRGQETSDSAKEEVPLVEAEEEEAEKEAVAEVVQVEDSAAELLLVATAVAAPAAVAVVAAPKKKGGKPPAVKTPPAAAAAAVNPAQKAVERPANGNNSSSAAAHAAPVSRAPSAERRPVPRVVTVERKPSPFQQQQQSTEQRDGSRGRKSGEGGRPSSRMGAKPSPPPPFAVHAETAAALPPKPVAAAKPPPQPTAVPAMAEPAEQPAAAPQPQLPDEQQQPEENAAVPAAPAGAAAPLPAAPLPTLPAAAPMAPPPHGMPPPSFFYGYVPHIPGQPLPPLPPGVLMHGMPPPMPTFIQNGGGLVQMPPHMPPGAAAAGPPHPGMPPHPQMVQGMLPLPPPGGAPPMLPHFYHHHPMAMEHPPMHMGMPMAMGMPMQPHAPSQGGPPGGLGGMQPPYPMRSAVVAVPPQSKPHSHRSAEAERSGNRFLAMVREAQQRGSSSEQRELDAAKPAHEKQQAKQHTQGAAIAPSAAAAARDTEAPPAPEASSAAPPADSTKPATAVSRFHARNIPEGLSRASSIASASVRSDSPFGRLHQSSGSERERERDHQQPRHPRRRRSDGGGGGSRRSSGSREGTSDEGPKRTGGRGGRQGRWASNGAAAAANPAKDSPAAGKALPPSAHNGDWTIQAR